MNKYVQFVVCRHTDGTKKFLFYAPTVTDIKIGDEVLVDTQFGEKRATVLETCNAFTGSDVEKTLRALAGAEDKPIKRVIGKYQFIEFYYSEDETNE